MISCCVLCLSKVTVSVMFLHGGLFLTRGDATSDDVGIGRDFERQAAH